MEKFVFLTGELTAYKDITLHLEDREFTLPKIRQYSFFIPHTFSDIDYDHALYCVKTMFKLCYSDAKDIKVHINNMIRITEKEFEKNLGTINKDRFMLWFDTTISKEVISKILKNPKNKVDEVACFVLDPEHNWTVVFTEEKGFIFVNVEASLWRLPDEEEEKEISNLKLDAQKFFTVKLSNQVRS